MMRCGNSFDDWAALHEPRQGYTASRRRLLAGIMRDGRYRFSAGCREREAAERSILCVEDDFASAAFLYTAAVSHYLATYVLSLTEHLCGYLPAGEALRLPSTPAREAFDISRSTLLISG